MFLTKKTSYLVNDGSEREIDRVEAKVTISFKFSKMKF